VPHRAPRGERKSTIRIGTEMFVMIQDGNFNDRYIELEVIGEGAYGKVCKVIHKPTELIRAMKAIKKSNVVKEKHEKFINEVKILKKLDHPNIMKVFELW
jgi:calcium-dependent protein kinase